MWHFSMQGLPSNDVTITSHELLPHVFTFSPFGVVIFCGTICSAVLHVATQHKQTRLFTGALLCAVQTFLLPAKRQESDNPACSNNFKEMNAKIITDCRIIRISLIFSFRPYVSTVIENIFLLNCTAAFLSLRFRSFYDNGFTP